MKFIKLSFLIFALFFFGCNVPEKEIPIAVVSNEIFNKDSIVLKIDSIEVNTKIDSVIDVLVVQISNGYEYAQFGYDFEPIIEKELSQFENINVIPFPYKKLMGVSYQGVFDKKYCKPIIEKVDVDFLILSIFKGNLLEIGQKIPIWGYEIRIVNANNMEQANSIGADNLKDYSQIENHIKREIRQLKKDIEDMK